MFDLKVINSVLNQLEDERGVSREKAIDAIEQALATAYKKEYGKKGQIIRANFNQDTGESEFYQVKIVVDESTAILPDEERDGDGDERVRFNPDHHIMLEDAQKIKRDAELDEEIIFPLEDKDDYGRISAQTAKQVIIQKIREAEKVSVYEEFESKKGEIVNGTVQRSERGNIFVDLGRATGILPYKEQIPGERFRQGERVRAYLQDVDESRRGVFLRLSRSSAEFLKALFALEAPEIASGVVEIKAIAREPGSRAKVAVHSNDEYIDPVGACVGQRGVRVSTVMSELGNEKIDIIEWSDNDEIFVEEAISPAEALKVDIDADEQIAHVLVSPDQQSLAIGKGGQNARLAAKLTGYKIDIQSTEEPGESDDVDAEADPDDGEVEVLDEENETTEATDNDTVDDVQETTSDEVADEEADSDEPEAREDNDNEVANGESDGESDETDSEETDTAETENEDDESDEAEEEPEENNEEEEDEKE